MHDVDMHFVQPKVFVSMNELLLIPYEKNGISQAIKEMYPLKAPRPNGLFPIFYKKYWLIVRDDVCDLVQQILRGDEFSIN